MGGSQTGGTGVSPVRGEEEKRKLLLATAINVSAWSQPEDDFPRNRHLTPAQKACSLSDVGTWLSLVEHCIRDAGVAGSNPVVPTKEINKLGRIAPGLFSLASLSSYHPVTFFHRIGLRN